MADRDFTERDIHLALDGEMPADERGPFERWLAANPEMQARRHRLVEDQKTLQIALAPILDEPAPERLKTAVAGDATTPRKWVTPWMRVAAAIFLVAAGAAAGYAAATRMPAADENNSASLPLAEEALKAHGIYSAEKLHVVEVGADQKDHLVGWLSKRVGTKLVAPELYDVGGFSLVGGRLLPAKDGVAAQFMYQDHTGNRVSLYVTDGVKGSETGFRLFEQGGARAYYWIDGECGYAVAGMIPEAVLMRIANSSYRQLLAAEEEGSG